MRREKDEYVTVVSYRYRWRYIDTKRKFKHRVIRVPFGYLIITSYRKVKEE